MLKLIPLLTPQSTQWTAVSVMRRAHQVRNIPDFYPSKTFTLALTNARVLPLNYGIPLLTAIVMLYCEATNRGIRYINPGVSYFDKHLRMPNPVGSRR